MESDKEPDKKYIRLYVLSCFHQKKSSAGAHRIICETYSENVRTCANWFKWFENDDFDINDKECFGRLQLWKRTNCGKSGKR